VGCVENGGVRVSSLSLPPSPFLKQKNFHLEQQQIFIYEISQPSYRILKLIEEIPSIMFFMSNSIYSEMKFFQMFLGCYWYFAPGVPFTQLVKRTLTVIAVADAALMFAWIRACRPHRQAFLHQFAATTPT
jgi:hypothetical protein